jgi:hypothetical protein
MTLVEFVAQDIERMNAHRKAIVQIKKLMEQPKWFEHSKDL